MYRKEIFRAQNTVGNDNGDVFGPLTFSVYEGELLGIHCPINSFSDGSFIAKLIMNQYRLNGGSLFYNEMLYPLSMRNPPLQIAYIGQSFSLIDTLSVQDNIYLLRHRQNRQLLYRKSKIQKEAERRFQEYDLPFRPEKMVKDLTLIEKYMLEVFRAYIHGANIILIDKFSMEFLNDEQFSKLISQLKKENLSFVMTSEHLHTLELFADRIAFFDGRQIIAAFENTPEYTSSIMRTYSSFLHVHKNHHQTAARTSQANPVKIDDPLFNDLRLTDGETISLFDPDMILYEHLLEIARKNEILAAGSYLLTTEALIPPYKSYKIVIADFNNAYDAAIPGLSAIDNMFLGKYSKFTACRLIRHGHRHVLQKEFLEKFQDAEFLEKKDCTDLTKRQMTELFLFRISLLNPSVLILWGGPHGAPEQFDILRSFSRTFTQGGGIMCYLASDIYSYLESADRYVHIIQGTVKSYPSFEQMRADFSSQSATKNSPETQNREEL